MTDTTHNGAVTGDIATGHPSSSGLNGDDHELKPAVVQSVETAHQPDAQVTTNGAHPRPSAEVAVAITAGSGHGDIDDDSEAETVLSSPVKRREALKGTQSQISDNIAPMLHAQISTQPIDSVAAISAPDPVPAADVDKPVLEQQTLASTESDALPDPVKNVEKHSRTQSMSSELSRDNASPENSRSESHPSSSQPVNPRKRKFRESSLNGSVKHDDIDSKHQRRESEESKRTNRLSSAKASRAGSPSDKSREPTANGSDPTRKRRAASHRPTVESKSAVNMWGDSDEDSSGGDQPPMSATSRAPRALNRSVSTPGRPAARDHKRHVNRYGFTRLAEACESGDIAAVKDWREKDPEQLNIREFAGNTPLQIASLNGCTEIVHYLISQGCDRHCANSDNDTPLIDAVENGHADTVQVLLDAGVNPLWQNLKGQQALDLISADTENASEMRVMLRKATESWREQGDTAMSPQAGGPAYRPGPKQGLQFLARTPENLLKLVIDNDRNGVLEFLDARVPVDNNIVAAAAKTGDVTLLNILLAEMSPKKAKSNAEKPMLDVIGSSHFDMVKALTDLDQFDPTWRSKADGMTWYELAEHRQGPRWKEEKALLYQLFQGRPAQHTSSTAANSPDKQRKEHHTKSSNGHAQDGSELESDASASPERARHRRRLISSKDKAANSRHESRSASPAGSSASVRSETQNTTSTEPKPKRKPGRTRTKSLTATQQPVIEQKPSEHKIKRIRSGSIKDRPALFDMPSSQNMIPKRANPDDDRESAAGQSQSVLQEKLRRDAEQQEKLEEERRQKAEAERVAAEQEATRVAAEEAARVERVRQEAILREKQRRRDDLLVARKTYCETLPSALWYPHMSASRNRNPLAEAEYIKSHFLPLLAVAAKYIGFATVPGDKLYVPSYQVAGLLSTDAAMQVLGVESEEDHRCIAGADASFYASQHNPNIVPQHRGGVHAAIGSERFIDDLDNHRPSEDEWPTDYDAECKIWDTLQAVNGLQRQKFNNMSGLRWVSLDDVQSLLESDLERSPSEVTPQQNGDFYVSPVGHRCAVWNHLDPAGALDDRPRIRASHYRVVKLWLPLPADQVLPLSDQPKSTVEPNTAEAQPASLDVLMSDAPPPYTTTDAAQAGQPAEQTLWKYHPATSESIVKLPVTDYEVVEDGLSAEEEEEVLPVIVKKT